METDLYLRVREKEGRLYSDDIVSQLPFISNDNPLADEWHARSASASRLTHYLSTRPKPLHILDLGCGNGWLSNMLAVSGHHVIGMDQNSYELKQAVRVFSLNPRLLFFNGDIFSAPFSTFQFDVIVLASVVQYFKDIKALLSTLSNYLKPQGEIHLIDSPFYSSDELEKATLRSQEYYSSIGFPEMSEYYFHHRASDLQTFQPQRLYSPQPFLLRLKRLLGQADSPFPWFVIRK